MMSVISILFVIALIATFGFAIGFYVAMNMYYLQGMQDEAAKWKDKISVRNAQRAED